MRLLSLAAGGLLVDAVGVEPVYWIGGTLLAAAGLLGLALLGRHDFRTSQTLPACPAAQLVRVSRAERACRARERSTHLYASAPRPCRRHRTLLPPFTTA